jgi:hypothetical protein
MVGRATGCSGYENRFDFQSEGLSFSCAALATGKAKRVEPVPTSKGIKKAPTFSPGASSRVLKSKGSLPRRSDAIPKAQINQLAVQKMQAAVQKNAG